MDQYSSDTGNLNVIVTGTDSYSPLSSATIEIANTGEPNRILESITTDQNGQTGYIELSAPPREYSMEPTDNQPYSEYNVKISAPGYQEGLVSGVQIFSGENGLQSIVLQPSEQTPDYVYNPIVIGGHTLWEYYPPKIAEPEIKPLAESGEIVLSRVVVPETIVVHDGVPGDSTATDYYVPYIDYIKNVACCEIYSTWSESTIEANILAIMSFTLNRVYTEWYRNKGIISQLHPPPLTITNGSTARPFTRISRRLPTGSTTAISPVQMSSSRFSHNTAMASASPVQTG